MKDIVKYLLIFAGGVGVGLAGSSFFFKKKYDAKYRKLADEEIGEMQKYYDEKLEQLENSVDEVFVKEVFGEDKKPENKVEKPAGPKLMDTSAIEYTQFYKVEKPSVETEHPTDDDEEDIDIPEVAPVRQTSKRSEPYPIKTGEFGTLPTYDAIELTYYQEDDIVTVGEDQDEQVINNFDEEESAIAGVLNKYQFKENDQGVICIRNDNRMTDYRVTKIYGPFYE